MSWELTAGSGGLIVGGGFDGEVLKNASPDPPVQESSMNLVVPEQV